MENGHSGKKHEGPSGVTVSLISTLLSFITCRSLRDNGIFCPLRCVCARVCYELVDVSRIKRELPSV